MDTSSVGFDPLPHVGRHMAAGAAGTTGEACGDNGAEVGTSAQRVEFKR